MHSNKVTILNVYIGLEVWPDGSRYEGNFVDDLRHGEGHHSWPNGEVTIPCFFALHYRLELLAWTVSLNVIYIILVNLLDAYD